MKIQDSTLYRCSDFDVVCVLKYSGCNQVKIEKEEGKRIWCFERSTRMDEILEQYWQGTLTVNVVDFLAVQRLMKSSLRNQ